jgi:serine/threonine protein kinase
VVVSSKNPARLPTDSNNDKCSLQQAQTTLPLGVTLRDTHGASYVVEGFLGKGGFGAVYVVRDRRIKSNLFALKELISQDKLDRECFIFEGELLKRLDHRSLPHVYSVFEHKKLQRVYMLMDYIQGRNLADLCQEQPEKRLAFPLVLTLLAPIVDALIYLHRQDQPIVHRDIKPRNIIVPEEGHETMLVDFGAAKEYDSEATTTLIRQVTSGYAAPEQYMSGTNPRTDIYGLGATLYMLLSGQTPPDALVRATRSHGADPLKPANLITPAIPMPVAQIIQRAMSLSSDDRFETVEEFWQQLHAHAPERLRLVPGISSERASRSLLPPVRNQGRPTAAGVQDQRPASRLRNHPALLLVLLALLLTLTMGTGFLLHARNYDLAASPQQRHISLSDPGEQSPPTLIPRASIYPPLAASYAGTIFDLMTREKTPFLLTALQQNQEGIHGSFQGLGLVGPFTGTVTSAGQVRFTVTIYAGAATLVFDGIIKIGGDLAGSFAAVDQHGQRTGESGLWNVSASP